MGLADSGPQRQTYSSSCYSPLIAHATIYAIFNVNSRDLLTRLSRISVVFVVVVLRHHSVARQDGLYGAILLLE
jgi:hypothetical protein